MLIQSNSGQLLKAQLTLDQAVMLRGTYYHMMCMLLMIFYQHVFYFWKLRMLSG